MWQRRIRFSTFGKIPTHQECIGFCLNALCDTNMRDQRASQISCLRFKRSTGVQEALRNISIMNIINSSCCRWRGDDIEADIIFQPACELQQHSREAGRCFVQQNGGGAFPSERSVSTQGHNLTQLNWRAGDWAEIGCTHVSFIFSIFTKFSFLI